MIYPNETPTPHIDAKDNSNISKVVLMPGDPLRAKYIAETYLKDIVQFNNVRGMLGFTGTYKGKKISVMGSGMGMPSIGIYSYELFNFYNVETIIRIGSCGSFSPDIDLMDIIVADKAYSESSFAKVGHGIDDKYLQSDSQLYENIIKKAKELDIRVVGGNIMSNDVFYATELSGDFEAAMENGIVGGEMEAFALFTNAKVLGKKAACLLTVSDNILMQTALSSQQRQTAFKDMMEIALNIAMDIA